MRIPPPLRPAAGTVPPTALVLSFHYTKDEADVEKSLPRLPTHSDQQSPQMRGFAGGGASETIVKAPQAAANWADA